MLALSRKKGESLIINNNIEVMILESHGDQVKIGISAPKEIPVYRKEVYLQIQKENEEAMATDKLSALNDLLGKKKD
jgi:carbon storage regulator